jgi:hypothetical protein
LLYLTPPPLVCFLQYYTQPGMCDTAQQRADNTIAGCCCITGDITVIHVKGSMLAAITSNLNATGGEMCGAGTVSVKNPNSNPPNKVTEYTFATPVDISAQLSFNLRQKVISATDLGGSFNLGPDPFDFQLVTGKTDYDNLLIITNNAPSDRAPRVCSIAAKSSANSKIDTTGMEIPYDPEDPDNGPASAVQVSMLTIAFAAMVAMVAGKRL